MAPLRGPGFARTNGSSPCERRLSTRGRHRSEPRWFGCGGATHRVRCAPIRGTSCIKRASPFITTGRYYCARKRRLTGRRRTVRRDGRSRNAAGYPLLASGSVDIHALVPTRPGMGSARYREPASQSRKSGKRGTWGGIQGGVRAWLGWAVTSRREAVIDFPTGLQYLHPYCYNSVIPAVEQLWLRFGPCRGGPAGAEMRRLPGHRLPPREPGSR
jgi:hypothetical protein